MGFLGGSVGQGPACNAVDAGNGFDCWVGKIFWRRVQQATPVFLPGDTHGQRSLAGLQSTGRRARYD